VVSLLCGLCRVAEVLYAGRKLYHTGYTCGAVLGCEIEDAFSFRVLQHTFCCREGIAGHILLNPSLFEIRPELVSPLGLENHSLKRKIILNKVQAEYSRAQNNVDV